MCPDLSWGICLRCSQIVAKWVTSRLVNPFLTSRGTLKKKTGEISRAGRSGAVVYLLRGPDCRWIHQLDLGHQRCIILFPLLEIHFLPAISITIKTHWDPQPIGSEFLQEPLHLTPGLGRPCTEVLLTVPPIWMPVAARAWGLCKAAMPSSSFWGAENYKTLGELHQHHMESLCLSAHPPMRPFFWSKNKLFLSF